MATQTRLTGVHGDFGDGTPVATFGYDYDDVTLRLTAFVVDIRSGQLPTDHPQYNTRGWARAELTDGTRAREAFFDPNPPGQPTRIPISTAAAVRLQLVLRPPKNSLDGVSISSMWPA